MPFLQRLKSAFKALPFPGSSGAPSSPQVIFPTLNDLSAAVLRLVSPQTQPSEDPHLSSLVAAGWTWLGNTMGEPDVLVKKEFLRKRSGKQRDDNTIERHRLYELLSEPNPFYSAAELWSAFAYSWIIAGNVYWLKFRNDFGQVVEIWPEPHSCVRARWLGDKQADYIPGDRSQSHRSVERNDKPNQFINYYELDRDGTKYRVETADIVHFRDVPDPVNRRYGISKMQLILREIYGDAAMANYAGNLLGGNGVIPYVLGIDDKEGLLNQEDLDQIKAKMIEQTTGTNAGKPLVLSSRLTFNRTGLTPRELDLRTSRYMAEEVFSRVTGIPAIVLNFGAGMERTIYNNMQQADRRAVDQYLQPLWWRTAQTLTRQLLRDIDQDASHFVEFDLSEVGALQEDENDRAKRIALLYEKNIIKRSEARSEFNYEVDPGGADDVYFYRASAETKTVEQEEKSREMSLDAMENPPEPQQIGEGQQPRLLQAVNARQNVS